jgi:hypothetical protein
MGTLLMAALGTRRAWLFGLAVAVVSVSGCDRSPLTGRSSSGAAGASGTTGRGGSDLVVDGGAIVVVFDAGGGRGGVTGSGLRPGTGLEGFGGHGGTSAGPVVRGGLFSVCLSSSECELGLVCACGAICTVRCSAASNPCADLSPGAVCPDLIPLTGDCNPTAAGCVQQCDSDEMCRPLGPTAACLDGWCKIPQPSTIVDGGAPNCDDLMAPLRTQVQSAIASADRSCQVDADCDNVSASNSCYGNSCPLTYVSKAGGAQLTMLLEALDAQYCGALLRSGCVLPEGIHGCPAYRSPVCVNGVCVQKPFPGQPDAARD